MQVIGRFEFWGEPDLIKKQNLVIGDEVLIKTNGESPLIHVLQKTTVSKFANQEGGELMDQISSKSSAFGAKQGAMMEQDEREGVAEDEWND